MNTATLPGQTDGVLRPHPGEPDRTDAFLPAPDVQNHAANLMELPGGDLGCVWFGGTQEGVPDIGVWFSLLAPGATAWSAPVRLSDDPTRSEQNPLLFVAPDGVVWLLHTAQVAGNQDTAEVRVRTSTDGGTTWSPTRTLFPAGPDGGVFVRQPIVVLAGGRWLLPIWHCVTPPSGRWVGDLDTSAVLVSDDAGATWREVPVPGSTGQVHMNIVPLANGELLALYRSRRADFVHASRSTDGGDSWSAPEPLDLPNNNSSIQCVALRDGRLALVYNHSSAADATGRRTSLYDEIDDSGDDGAVREGAFWGAPRAPMSLAFSSDGGRTWPVRRDLETSDGHCLTNDSAGKRNRELSYPAIREAADGGLHIAFTYFRQAIEYVHLTHG
ncbi:exo-alpha-sialidase [Pseudonocardia sp. DSM 110487]|uniref:sialidase family protein n=1 Tax=Pseudonocardia sp. DSM 110487 TaxID=2865833 RepID=UPI001C69A3B9|nr:sialidase family protein [Pseudonocardia sp. DSM 110487]QYN32548.1 exo-alpha-sialidase [Pseudonocardia sp. DSM 110487]